MKKKLSLILAMLLLLSGCSSAPAEKESETSDVPENTGSAAAEETEAVTEPEVTPDLPDKKFNGENINFLVRGEKVQPTNFSHEIYAAEENGESINDAVYRRNMSVQEQFDVVITETSEDDSIDVVRNSVLAKDGMYDVVMVRPNRVITLAADGMLCDLKTAPYLDMTAAWWDQNSAEALTFNDKLYFINGDINIMDNNAIWATMFNKNLFDANGLEYPYEAVKSGKWVLDEFIRLANVGGKDLDGNGTMDEFDQYGLITSDENIYPLVVASDKRLANVENGTVEINPDVEGIHGALDKILALCADTSVTLRAESYKDKGYSNVWSEVMRASFREGRGLLYVSGILSTTYLRDMEDEFGIVPLPKANEEQTEYKTWMNLNNSSMFAIPASNDNLDLTGIVSEALAYESTKTLTPAYYETTLSGKVARDEDSVAMLDIIIDSVSFDFANIFNLCSVTQLYAKGAVSGENTFASDFAAMSRSMKAELKRLTRIYGKSAE